MGDCRGSVSDGVMSDDLYEMLGVSRDAGQDDIKRRYRQLAKLILNSWA